MKTLFIFTKSIVVLASVLLWIAVFAMAVADGSRLRAYSLSAAHDIHTLGSDITATISPGTASSGSQSSAAPAADPNASAIDDLRKRLDDLNQRCNQKEQILAMYHRAVREFLIAQETEDAPRRELQNSANMLYILAEGESAPLPEGLQEIKLTRISTAAGDVYSLRTPTMQEDWIAQKHDRVYFDCGKVKVHIQILQRVAGDRLALLVIPLHKR